LNYLEVTIITDEDPLYSYKLQMKVLFSWFDFTYVSFDRSLWIISRITWNLNPICYVWLWKIEFAKFIWLSHNNFCSAKKLWSKSLKNINVLIFEFVPTSINYVLQFIEVAKIYLNLIDINQISLSIIWC
jgi:hypothetical protein